jgi:hypothetical protein
MLLASSPVTRDRWSAEVTWDVETSMSWHDYVAHVRRELAAFIGVPTAGQVERFRRTLPGDTRTVRVEQLAFGPPLRIRVTFHSMPN